MEIHAGVNAIACDLDAGGGPESLFKVAKIGNAVLWRRVGAEQRAKRTAMHGTGRPVISDREHQGIDVGTPAHFVVQTTPGWNGLATEQRPFMKLRGPA